MSSGFSRQSPFPDPLAAHVDLWHGRWRVRSREQRVHFAALFRPERRLFILKTDSSNRLLMVLNRDLPDRFLGITADFYQFGKKIVVPIISDEIDAYRP